MDGDILTQVVVVLFYWVFVIKRIILKWRRQRQAECQRATYTNDQSYCLFSSKCLADIA